MIDVTRAFERIADAAVSFGPGPLSLRLGSADANGVAPLRLAEDVLVEDFPDPADGQPLPVSELVKSLGLPGRRGLPRTTIAIALQRTRVFMRL